MSIISLQVCRDTLYKYQNLIIVIGLIISFSGGSWDITFHILSQPESFFSYPHTLVYTGIFIVISIFFINIRKNISNNNPTRNDNYFILLGAVLILAAGPIDFSWHLKFGLDGLLSPPHVTLLIGWLLVGLGNLRITNNLINLTLKKKRSSKSNSVDGGDLDYQNYDKNDDELRSVNNTAENTFRKELTVIRFQLFLNLSFILLILSGFIYFFSLPFSETQHYNYNPDPLIAFFVYSLGFPFLLSCFFIRILKNYPEFDEMVLLVGSFYVIIMLLTQIVSNPFLFEYSGYYLLNIIPFVVIYFLNKVQIKNRFTQKKTLDTPSLSNDKAKKYANIQLYILYALIISISLFTICFPLNTYILNEELYGYLLYQNLVPKVYVQLFGDYFLIIISLSIVGGLLGLGLGMGKGKSAASKYNLV
ncbi:hypothetical protein [Candidatus Nitrosocosmicus arcticus]|uniref:Uncharacterized protein n=1 Tax=Candidatus Nitrosocosmicus arcticus TaxID=2035267 RepID=A0A557SYH0_9ARCH|nr:hypothetical protein [Candidatus Nitrosocosmicus arcticus]TVP41657.1 membrane protein of unknown function [Candidatus Nitrosocosmicus arcticus]